MRRAICGTALAAVWLVTGSPAFPDDRRDAESKAAEALSLGGAAINETMYKPGDAVWSVTLRYYVVPSRPQPTDDDLVALEHLPRLRILSLAYTKVSDWGLDHVRGCKHLEELSLWSTAITDAGLDRLKELTNLSSLQLGRTEITDAGLVHLKKLIKMRELDLHETAIGDPGLAHLKNLTQIRILRLGQTRVTDEGLAHLQKLGRLERLELDNTAITDNGLKHLKGLGQLRFLDLRGTKVTDQGKAELQKALPEVSIRLKYEPLPPRPPYYYPLRWPASSGRKWSFVPGR
jgi:hypothetical protein